MGTEQECAGGGRHTFMLNGVCIVCYTYLCGCTRAQVEREGHRCSRKAKVPVEREEQIARAFHETYELLAPGFNYKTRAESAVPWDEVPQENRRLMRATVITLLNEGIIQ